MVNSTKSLVISVMSHYTFKTKKTINLMTHADLEP